MAEVSKKIRDTTFLVSQQQSQIAYQTWVNEYEKDMVTTLGWSVPQTCVDLLLKHGNVNENTTVLDCGAGTGLFSFHLRRKGFQGTIDLLDASYEMLSEARKKNFAYRNMFVHLITKDGQLPLFDNQYDVFVCTGCFIPGHVNAEAFEGLIKVVKPGGLIIYNLRYTEQENDYFGEFNAVVKKLEGAKTIEPVEMKQIHHFKTEDIPNMYSNCYICRKL